MYKYLIESDNGQLISRLTVVSCVAKESRIYMHAIIKNATTVKIYTNNNGACIHPY